MSKPEFTDDPVTVEREEIERLAELLVNAEASSDLALGRWRRSEVVKFILDNYRPRLAWYETEPDPEPGESSWSRVRTKFYVCQLRIGGRVLTYRFPYREGAQHPLDDNAWYHLRHQMTAKLGVAFARWADGEEEK